MFQLFFDIQAENKEFLFKKLTGEDHFTLGSPKGSKQ